FFWRFCDEEDPTYPGENPYQNVIKEFYQIYDNILGEFMEAHPEITTIVFSDHGHAMRPVRTVNMNEVLRKKGLLKARSGALNPAPFILENLKRISLDLIRKFELDHLMVRVSKSKALSSISKDIYMSSASIDLDRSMAYLSSFAGPKSYSHGGIEVNEGNLAGGSYEELRTMLIDELSGLTEPETGQELVKWICRREELYQGSNIHLYPDVVFELVEGYGVFWGIHTPLIGTAYEHTLASGGHHRDAVFLIANGTEQPKSNNISIMDIGPTILHLLDIKPEEEIDGKCIF
ncbi:MAG: alkaline phosphatase family protein, partial [ANME-2 cluster archaeon]|nr:alkaline phosphatase family protein [ANME-2 cluster archaeon]